MDIASRRRDHFIAWMRANGTNSRQVAQAAGVPYTTLNSYEKADTRSLTGENEAKIAGAFEEPIEAMFGSVVPQPNFLKAWRERLGMSEEDVAKQTGSTVAVVRLRESGDYAVSPKWLRQLSPVLKIGQGILRLDPASVPDEVLQLYAAVEQRSEADRVIEQYKAKAG